MNYRVLKPADWFAIKYTEEDGFKTVRFESDKVRRLRFNVKVTQLTSVWLLKNGTDNRDILLGVTQDMSSFEVHVEGDAVIGFDADPDTDIFVSGESQDHKIAKGKGEAFTTVSPRARRNTEFDQMMMMMKLNEKSRNEKLATENARREKEHQEAIARSEKSTDEALTKISQKASETKEPEKAKEVVDETEKTPSA